MLYTDRSRSSAHGIRHVAAGFAMPSMRVLAGLALTLCLAVACLVSTPARASETTADAMALARANVCLGCHQVDARRVGPPFRAIGERFAGKGDEAANAAYLAQAIQKGSRGNWGALTMPAQPQVDDDEARQLANWILSLGKTTP